MQECSSKYSGSFFESETMAGPVVDSMFPFWTLPIDLFPITINPVGPP